MLDFISQLTGKAARTVKNWWLLCIAGLACIAAGIAVFCFPSDSYLLFSCIFGAVMLITGVVELTVAASSRNWFMMRGYNIVGGILDILVGILLCAWPGVTMVTLPIFLGIWLIYHSFMIIGLAGDFGAFHVKGSGWLVFGGILILFLGIFITLNPLTAGATVIVWLLGAGLIVFGAVLTSTSVRLGRLHKYFKSLGVESEVEEQ